MSTDPTRMLTAQTTNKIVINFLPLFDYNRAEAVPRTKIPAPSVTKPVDVPVLGRECLSIGQATFLLTNFTEVVELLLLKVSQR